MEISDQAVICANFVFYNNFDSANLAKVEKVKNSDECESNVKSNGNKNYEFNLWTKHDCHGTEFQNTNRTWFYFGIKSPSQGILVKLNIINLNKQSKMFSQGMCPVFRVIPGHPRWERIRDKPSYTMDQKSNEFTLSFTFRTPENPKGITYIAFTYPFTYSDLQYYLNKIDIKLFKQNFLNSDSIYYFRECAIKSLEGRRLELITISSYHNITSEREKRFNGMFPNIESERPFKFHGKKIIFISARVHPGETPSSFVLNGFLNFLLNPDDQIANLLRRLYVFKLIPMLNPDGVARGHYRMDTRGCNLNRVYLNPSIQDHPTIYAATTLIKYYHNYYHDIDDPLDLLNDDIKLEINEETIITDKDKMEKNDINHITTDQQIELMQQRNNEKYLKTEQKIDDISNSKNIIKKSEESGLFLYIDLHGHASKKGIFMYGNYFENSDDTVTCMLLPKLMSINDPNFHFTSCNFAERNMYVVDKKDGMSREGSGRVAVYKMTGLIRSYTLECNYNSGRLVNSIPPRIRDNVVKRPGIIFVPPKYTPTLFEEVGAALGPSILDLTNSNPNSRLANSQYRSLRGVKSYLKLNVAGNINKLQIKVNKDSNHFIDTEIRQCSLSE